MKKIAVSQSIQDVPDRFERRDFIDQQLVRFISEQNFVPIPVPNVFFYLKENSQSAKTLSDWLHEIKIDGIVLSGGSNIGVCQDRDSTERALLNYAEKNHLPLLGICRGMQMMGVEMGARLCQVDGHVSTSHSVVGDRSAIVNSYHNLAFLECPNKYNIMLNSEDGVIEAIQHEFLPWQGWMWHPEREKIFDQSDKDNFRTLFS